MSDDSAAYDPTHPAHIGPMGEMAQQALEEAERQWLSEHPGFTVEDYERDIERKYQEEEKRQRAKAIATRLQTTVEALQDGTYWVGKDGRKISIWTIDKRYAKNLIRWFEERRKGLHDSACIWFMALPLPSGEQAGYAYDEEFDRLNEMEPAEWLNNQPLYKHLKLIASGKDLIMSEKQKFSFQCSNPENGEVRESWVEAVSKIEATQKFLRRKNTAEWFLEGNPIKIVVLDEIERKNWSKAFSAAIHDQQKLPESTEPDGSSGDATEFLQQVEKRAKELYAISNQGRWEDLDPSLQESWINTAGRELRGED